VLVRELLAAGRRVFVIRTQMPEDVLERVLAGVAVETVASPSELDIVELRSLGS
jgi:hypothetical protein